MKDTCEILTGIFKEFNDKTCRPFNLKEFAERGVNMLSEKEIMEFLDSFKGTNKDLNHLKDVKVMENHSTEEQLKEKISWLKSELNLKTLELADKERYYTDKIEKLEQKVESLKEDRKHLLQDKNAVINLTKSFSDDIISCTIYEVSGMLQNYYKKLIDLNKDTNDSNTKVYLEVKKARDNYKRLLNMYKRRSKDLYKQNQMLLQDIDKLKSEIDEERERTRLAFKALKLQTKGK